MILLYSSRFFLRSSSNNFLHLWIRRNHRLATQWSWGSCLEYVGLTLEYVGLTDYVVVMSCLYIQFWRNFGWLYDGRWKSLSLVIKDARLIAWRSSVFQMLVVTLVLSRLDYRLPANLLNRLQSVLNAAAAGLRRSDHITDTLASFHWLQAPERIKFKLTLLPVFTGCEHLSASSLNWQSLSTELFTALHLGICLICYIVFLALHQDAVSGRSSTCSKLVIPLSRLVTAGDRSLLLPAPDLEHSAQGHCICAVFTGVPTKTGYSFVSAILSGYCIVACDLLRPLVLEIVT